MGGWNARMETKRQTSSEDGPAIIFSDGSAMWRIDDRRVDVEPPDDSELARFA